MRFFSQPTPSPPFPATDRPTASGSIPILQSMEHAGRNVREKRLGYKYLLASEFAARRKKFGGATPYCRRWAEHNLDIFLRHQSYINRRQTIHPNIDRCVAESFP